MNISDIEKRINDKYYIFCNDVSYFTAKIKDCESKSALAAVRVTGVFIMCIGIVMCAAAVPLIALSPPASLLLLAFGASLVGIGHDIFTVSQKVSELNQGALLTKEAFDEMIEDTLFSRMWKLNPIE